MTDFGLVKAVERVVDAGEGKSGEGEVQEWMDQLSLLDGGRTIDGVIMGTPRYMPPEQAKGEAERAEDKAAEAERARDEEKRQRTLASRRGEALQHQKQQLDEKLDAAYWQAYQKFHDQTNPTGRLLVAVVAQAHAEKTRARGAATLTGVNSRFRAGTASRNRFIGSSSKFELASLPECPFVSWSPGISNADLA